MVTKLTSEIIRKEPQHEKLCNAMMPALEKIVLEAAEMATRNFQLGKPTSVKTYYKNENHSPYTEVDLEIDFFLKKKLMELLPEAMWCSEESSYNHVKPTSDYEWVVDPIDGTRAYLGGLPNWCVVVTLLYRNRPCLAIVHAPQKQKTFKAIKNQFVTCNDQPIHVSTNPTLGDYSCLGASSIIQRALDTLEAPALFKMIESPKNYSLALRIATLAKGSDDIVFISENAPDWDIAAAQLILSQAGGKLYTLKGRSPIYNRRTQKRGLLIASNQRVFDALIAHKTPILDL